MIYLSNLNLSNNQLQNAVIHPLGTPPANPVEGQLYYNSTAGVKMLYVYNGTAWVPVGDITAITSTESRLIVTNGTSGDVNLSLDIATVVANGGTGLVTADLLYDYIVSLDAVTSVTAGTGISVTGTTSDPIINNTDPGSAQNIFKNIAVSGQSPVVADSNNDTLTLVGGGGTTITTNATTDTVTMTGPLPCLLTNISDKLLPLFAMPTITHILTVDALANILLNTSTITSFTISNCELCFDFIELGS